MKKIISVIIIINIFFIQSAYSADLRSYDKVEGTTLHTFWVSTTGSWQAVSIPSTIERVRHVFIQVHDGVESYTHVDNEVEFLYSRASDGEGWGHAIGLSLSIGKQGGDILIYIKAATGQEIAVTCLQ